MERGERKGGGRGRMREENRKMVCREGGGGFLEKEMVEMRKK